MIGIKWNKKHIVANNFYNTHERALMSLDNEKTSSNEAFSFVNSEANVLKFWQEKQIFKKSLEQTKDGEAYIFYDGPPFATGMPHHGHLVASTIKDIIPRYFTMKGRYVERRFGWDCHGLPIEHEAEKGRSENTLFNWSIKGHMSSCIFLVKSFGIDAKEVSLLHCLAIDCIKYELIFTRVRWSF